MVIENLNKYSEEQIASLQEKENVIRLIISEQPNRCNLEHLRKYAIKSDTNIQLCLCAEDNNIIKFDVFECLAEKVVDIEIYNRKRVLTSIIGISIFRNLNKLIISDLYDDKIVLDELVQLEKLEILGLVLNGDLDMRQYETINQLFSLRRLEVKGLDSMLLDKLPNLENLKCHNLKDGTQLGYKMPNLKSITIYKSPKIRDLNFLLGMKMIQCIYLYGLSNLSHVPNLCNLPNLRRIGICNMKRLEQMPTLNRELESLDVEKNVPMLGVDSMPEGVMPELSDCSASLTKEDIKNFEVELNVKIPAGMKNFYLKFNGGMPSPYCFQPQDEDLDWVEINAFFPIKERTNAFETIEVIAKDMWSRNLMPSNLLPFAMDSGGNYYALNLKNKKIYYYLTDEWDENASREYNFETNTRYIAQSFNYFINHFIEEEE